MKMSYDTDVVAWANEQAQFIRAERFDQLDLVHIAEDKEAPSLRTKFTDDSWVDLVWAKAKGQAETETETGLEVATFPEACPWPMAHVLDKDWLPDS